MLDFKKLWLKHYEDKINDAKIVSFTEAISLCDSIDDPVAYTSFILYCAYARAKDYAVTPKPAAVAQELVKTVPELAEVDKYVFVDAINLLETFNHATAIIVEYIYETQARLPYIAFYPFPWLYEAIDFLSWFRKDEHPLIRDWREFVLFLPQSYQGSTRSRIYLGFSDYARAVKEGKLDEWHRYYKAYAVKDSGFSFKEALSCLTWADDGSRVVGGKQ